MPLYDLCCADCGARREVRVSFNVLASLELLCVGCGGVLRRAAAPGKVALLRPVAERQDLPATLQRPAKACGHAHACRCAVKLTQPNPFQQQIDESLGSGAAETKG